MFNESVRDLFIPPLLDDEAALDAAVAPAIEQMLTVEVLDVEELTAVIDELSRTVLSPEDADDGDLEDDGAEAPDAEQPDASPTG